jgi:hypothetical protein
MCKNQNIENAFRESFVQREFEDTNGVIRIHKSKRDRQYNGQKKKDKQR